MIPIRFAKYWRGRLGPWQYTFAERKNIIKKSRKLKNKHGHNFAVQVLFIDIFVLFFYVERRGLYDPSCLESLYDREWTDTLDEKHDGDAENLPNFTEALRRYNKRTQNEDLDDSFGDTVSATLDHEVGYPIKVMKGLLRRELSMTASEKLEKSRPFNKK
ncbi:hypothetical protein F4804DRAFT_331822 [Jackrogersella minutella]|nr:hypothetical protein F4804DRAFT_331822 [Jackrogersella minutella]